MLVWRPMSALMATSVLVPLMRLVPFAGFAAFALMTLARFPPLALFARFPPLALVAANALIMLITAFVHIVAVVLVTDRPVSMRMRSTAPGQQHHAGDTDEPVLN